jgi:hypothetical protein
MYAVILRTLSGSRRSSLNAGTTIEIGTGESEWSDMKGVRFSGAFYRTVGAIFLLAVAGGLALWWWQSRLPDEQIYIPAPEKITAEVELLRGLSADRYE